MRISDWSSDVCSSDLRVRRARIGEPQIVLQHRANLRGDEAPLAEQMPAAFLELAHPRTAAAAEKDDRFGHHRAILGKAARQRIDPGAPGHVRSEARRVGTECVRTCRSRWSRYS